MNSTPASSKARRIVRLSSRGPRLSISNSATVDRPTPDTFANRRCDHCKSPLAARHCCEFMQDCNAFRCADQVVSNLADGFLLFKRSIDGTQVDPVCRIEKRKGYSVYASAYCPARR